MALAPLVCSLFLQSEQTIPGCVQRECDTEVQASLTTIMTHTWVNLLDDIWDSWWIIFRFCEIYPSKNIVKEWSVAVDRNDQSLKSRKSIKFGIDFFKKNLFYESVWLHLWQKQSMEMIVGRIKYVLLLAEMNMDREKKETGVYFNAMWVALRATLHFIDTCSHGTTMPPFFTRELAELVQCFVANFN